MYVKSTAVALQALCIISVGPLADSRKLKSSRSSGGMSLMRLAFWRKRLLVSFALVGSTSGILFLLIPSSPSSVIPLLAAILTVIGNIAYAVGTVCSNAFLPQLAKEDSAVQAAASGLTGQDQPEISEGQMSNAVPDALEPLLSAISTSDLAERVPITPLPQAKYDALLSLTTSRISSVGTAIGFFSGVSVLALLLIPVSASGGSTRGLQMAIALSGLWWGVFLLPAWIGLPGGVSSREQRSKRLGWMGQGWRRVGKMVRRKEIRGIPNLYMFLLAWVFLSDGQCNLYRPMSC